MRFSNILATAAAASLATAPVLAQAAGQPLPARESTALTAAENLRGGFIIPLIAIIAVILGILAATSDGEDPPSSP